MFVALFRCTATIAAVYWQSSEESVEGRLPQTGPALESKAVYNGEATGPAVESKSVYNGQVNGPALETKAVYNGD